MSRRDDVKGPFIRWDDYGCEGWHPVSYDTMEEALSDDRYGHQFTLTKVIEWRVIEKSVPSC